MTPEIWVLCVTAATIAFVHTLMGPDHYLPFVAMAKSRGWSVGRALRTTLVCGAGHIVGSVVLGFVGIYASIQLGALEAIEGYRGDLAAWALVSVGLVWMAWGLHRGSRKHSHSHWRSFCELTGHPELAEDERFIDMATRLKNINESYRVGGDDKLVLKPEQLPVKPEGCEDPVVWKWGVDSDPVLNDRDSQ